MITECKRCEATVDALMLHSYEDHCPPEEGPPGKYSFCRCPKCSSPFIVSQTDYGMGFEDDWQLYPPKERELSQSFPESVRAAYAEALACNRAKAYTAAAIMCRKTVEGLCAAHGVNDGNLASSLKTLKERAIIEARLFEWADALRLSGNEAAHGVDLTVTREDANDILEFTNALLEYVFTFRDRFDAFQKRRSKRKPPSNER